MKFQSGHNSFAGVKISRNFVCQIINNPKNRLATQDKIKQVFKIHYFSSQNDTISNIKDKITTLS